MFIRLATLHKFILYLHAFIHGLKKTGYRSYGSGHRKWKKSVTFLSDYYYYFNIYIIIFVFIVFLRLLIWNSCFRHCCAMAYFLYYCFLFYIKILRIASNAAVFFRSIFAINRIQIFQFWFTDLNNRYLL